MKTSREFLDELWKRTCGLTCNGPVIKPAYHVLRKSEWSEDFEQAMRYRMIIGAFRYGLLGDKNKPDFDRLESIRKRLNLYEKIGNLEHLVDIANLCLCEFVEGKHPKKHFSSSDDKHHTKRKKV